MRASISFYKFAEPVPAHAKINSSVQQGNVSKTTQYAMGLILKEVFSPHAFSIYF